MAHSAGMELNGFHAAGGYCFRVNGGIDICLHNRNTELLGEQGQKGAEGACLAGAGGGHQIYKESAFVRELMAQLGRVRIVVFKHALPQGDYFDIFHYLSSQIFKSTLKSFRKYSWRSALIGMVCLILITPGLQ